MEITLSLTSEQVDILTRVMTTVDQIRVRSGHPRELVIQDLISRLRQALPADMHRQLCADLCAAKKS